MRVLTIVSKLDIGGIEKTLLSCLPFLKKEAIQLTICCYAKGGHLEQQYKDAGTEIIYFKRSKIPFNDAVQLYKILKSGKYDVVHSRFGFTSGGFALACKRLSIPFIVSVHSERYFAKPKRENSRLLSAVTQAYLDLHKRLTLRYATRIIGHSKTNLQYYTQGNPNAASDKFQLIYNGIDFTKLAGNSPALGDEAAQFVADSNCTFLHIGSFREPKNHLYLIDCFKALNPLKEKYKLILVGNGSLFEQVKKKVMLEGLDSCVFFAGIDQNITKYLLIADLFFFPSIYEGLGNVLIEAQYMKVPVCASGLQPHHEATHEYYHQYFFDPYDIQDGCNKLQNIIRNIRERKIGEEVTTRAQEFVMNNFTIERMAGNLATVYKTIGSR
ncbi:glycosyltransferase [Chitinophaga varians]|uniref:glycosyltransferase n=1 Tax=Chitinophaga varians TaxID=2202339 RepID=UPI00165FABAE|nr:glycosyltransferase [Chitinophaga varians]MBC9908884.1 glycosyltransferase [Chitinophaga varians]